MKLSKIILFSGAAILLGGILLTSCQKMYRPELKELILDPEPPAYNPLKSFWAFENNTTDQGENKLTGTAVNLTYVAGIKGQAVKIGVDGYLLLKTVGDTVRYPNEFVSLPVDSIVNLGSYTISFWMNGTGPVTGGAQGIFSISNKNQFWGNLDIFLENWTNAGDATEGFLKIHQFNAGVASGNGEEWNELKIPNILNKWAHIAITYDAATSEFSLYANGQPTSINKKKLGGGNYGKIKYKDFNGMVLGTYQFQTNPTLSNHGPEGWAKSFNGALDQFRIYNKALSASEITNLFNSKD
jgi:hypothetical protein